MQQDPGSFAKERVIPAPAPLDWSRLVAALSAYQASTRTAQVAMLLDGPDRPAGTSACTLADLIEGGRAWTGAAAAMGGRFHGESRPESAVNRDPRS